MIDWYKMQIIKGFNKKTKQNNQINKESNSKITSDLYTVVVKSKNKSKGFFFLSAVVERLKQMLSSNHVLKVRPRVQSVNPPAMIVQPVPMGQLLLKCNMCIM